MEITTYIVMQDGERISVKEEAWKIMLDINRSPTHTFIEVTEVMQVFSSEKKKRITEERTIYINKNKIVKLIPNDDETKQ